MKLVWCSWYETQENKECAVSSTTLQKGQISVLLFLLLNNTSCTLKSFIRTRSVLTETFLGYRASFFMMLFLTLSPKYFEYVRPCFISRCHKCLHYSSTFFLKELTEVFLPYCMYIALVSSGSRFTIESLCTKNNHTILICWGMIAKLPGFRKSA